MKKEELRKRYEAIRDAWEFLKKHSDVLDTEEYWNAVMDEGKDIVKKYGDSSFSHGLIKEVILELGNIAKGE